LNNGGSFLYTKLVQRSPFHGTIEVGEGTKGKLGGNMCKTGPDLT